MLKKIFLIFFIFLLNSHLNAAPLNLFFPKENLELDRKGILIPNLKENNKSISSKVLKLYNKNYIKKNNSSIYIQSQDQYYSSGSKVVLKIYRKNKTYYNLASRGGQIISTAWRFLGVPYRWAGTTSMGFDCSGFVMRVFKLNGINLRRLADQQYYNGNPVNSQHLIPGDLVFFNTYSSGVTHVGIYIGGNQFIHASSSRGVTISNLNDSYYKSRFIGARRYY